MGEVLNLEWERLRRSDHIVRGTAAAGTVRAIAITARDTVAEARERHSTSPLVSAALGRLLMAGQMMGVMSKAGDELITLQIKGDGPIGGLTVTADNQGRAKGFANHPHVWLPDRTPGHLDVGGGIGAGELTVVFDRPGIAPYSSQVRLVSGEIGDDLTSYFALSDQVPSSVGLGVLIDTDTSIRRAGGFIIQLMPGATDAVAEALEERLSQVKSVTELLDAGMGPREMLDHILGELAFEELEVVRACFHCGCDEARAERAVMALGMSDLTDMVEQGETAEVICHFCGRRHHIAPERLAQLLAREEAE